jgi:hypothetical protein
MTTLTFGKEFWEKISPLSDAYLPASFASKTTCSRTEIQHQFGATQPTLSSASSDHPVQDGASRLDSWASILRALSRPNGASQFCSVTERYDLLTSVEVAGFLTLVQFVDTTGQLTPPVLMALGALVTQLQATTSLLAEDFVISDKQWEPSDIEVPDQCHPILATTWNLSRQSAPRELRRDVLQHASSHLVIPKGTKLLRPTLMHAISAECPFKSEDMEALRLTTQADFKACPVKENMPKRAINYSLKPKHFWYGFVALPLPLTHNIPLGFPIDISTVPSATSLVEILRSYTGRTDQDQEYEWLDNGYVDAWLWG